MPPQQGEIENLAHAYRVLDVRWDATPAPCPKNSFCRAYIGLGSVSAFVEHPHDSRTSFPALFIGGQAIRPKAVIVCALMLLWSLLLITLGSRKLVGIVRRMGMQSDFSTHQT